ncbi:MAG: HlyD family secretion protein [Bacteroidales bacterium]
MKIKRITIWLILFAFLSGAYLAVQHITLRYPLTGQGIVHAGYEWTLGKTIDGNLINSLRDNFNNSVTNYRVNEFQRGDVAEFKLREEILSKDFISSGDTVGFLHSGNEISRLLEMEGELESQQKLLDFYASGEKPEEIQVAYDRMVLARQQLENQEKIFNRNKALVERGHISEEEYELSQTEYQISYQNYLIAKSEHESLQSGAKPEQIEFIRANIRALEQNIEHLESLIDEFTIISPISGKIVRKQGNIPEFEVILRIADTSRMVAIVPMELYNIPYLEKGQSIHVVSPVDGTEVPATISGFDTSAHNINQKQYIFVSVIIDSEDAPGILPDMLIEAHLRSEPLNLIEYARRFMNEVYNN